MCLGIPSAETGPQSRRPALRGWWCLDRRRVSSESCMQVVSPSSAPGLILGQGGVCCPGPQGTPSGLRGPLQRTRLRGDFQHPGEMAQRRGLSPPGPLCTGTLESLHVSRAEGPELLINGWLRSERLLRPLTAVEGGRKEGRRGKAARWFGRVQHLHGTIMPSLPPSFEALHSGPAVPFPQPPSSYSHCWHRGFALGMSLNVHNIYLVFFSVFL